MRDSPLRPIAKTDARSNLPPGLSAQPQSRSIVIAVAIVVGSRLAQPLLGRVDADEDAFDSRERGLVTVALRRRIFSGVSTRRRW